MRNGFFYLGIGLLFIHALDAMNSNEWLILPLINLLPSKPAGMVSIMVHVPLFALLVALTLSTNEGVRTKTRFGVSAFLMLHGVLHVAFMEYDHYKFNAWLSDVLIFGSALCGLAYLLLKEEKSSS